MAMSPAEKQKEYRKRHAEKRTRLDVLLINDTAELLSNNAIELGLSKADYITVLVHGGINTHALNEYIIELTKLSNKYSKLPCTVTEKQPLSETSDTQTPPRVTNNPIKNKPDTAILNNMLPNTVTKYNGSTPLQPEIVKCLGVKGEAAIAKYVLEAKTALKIKKLNILPPQDRLAVLQWLKDKYCSELLKHKNIYQYEINDLVRQICTKSKGVFFARESTNGGKKYCGWSEIQKPNISEVDNKLYLSNQTGDSLLFNTGKLTH